MKKFLILVLFFMGCGSKTEYGKVREQASPSQQEQEQQGPDGFFSGKHVLTLISNITKNIEDTGYICVSDTGAEAKAQFYFYQKNGFLSAVIPQSKIRFSFLTDTANDTPYCKFRWNPNINGFKEIEWFNSMIYVVVCIKPNQIYRK